MDTHERRQAAYSAQLRAKYTDKQRQKMAGKEAMPDGSYPIADAEDLDNAIHAVGRGTQNSHNAIRKHIIARAKALNLSSKIPGNWNSDGSLKTDNAAELDGEERDRPTSEDWQVAHGLKNAKQALAAVKADQLADPDNKTDPDDEAVMSAIEAAEAAVDKAIVAQGKDGQFESKSANWATAKRAFSSLVERPPAHVVDLAVRMDDETDPAVAHFVGYASSTEVGYGVRDWLGEYDETIRAGAFAKTLRERPDVPMLRNHDANFVLANTSSDTSRLGEDGTGLRNEADFDRRQTYVNDLCISLQRRDVNKMSFSFQAVKEDWNDTYDKRGVSELKLFDTSVVTYPANPATSAELVDGMRSALGREGRSLWLADNELSVRSALPVLVERRELDADAEDLLERAMRALVHADEVLCRSHGPHGRARTFHVAEAMLELRAGKVLSAKNQALLQQAADALASADRHHAKTVAQHATASEALNTVLGGGDGTGNGTPPGNGNPIMPQDGAGPRSARALQLRREREAELRALRRR